MTASPEWINKSSISDYGAVKERKMSTSSNTKAQRSRSATYISRHAISPGRNQGKQGGVHHTGAALLESYMPVFTKDDVPIRKYKDLQCKSRKEGRSRLEWHSPREPPSLTSGIREMMIANRDASSASCRDSLSSWRCSSVSSTRSSLPWIAVEHDRAPRKKNINAWLGNADFSHLFRT